MILFLEWAEWKCHLAFLVPIGGICWPLSAIDKFKTYASQFEKLAITIPNSINSFTQSTAVILWGFGNRNATGIDALEADFDVWRNLNLKMIFQGLARSNVHIAHLDPEPFVPLLNDEHQFLVAKQNHMNWQRHIDDEDDKEKGREKVQRWLPAPPFRTKEFKGKKVISCLTI